MQALFSNIGKSEPWISTNDSHLRADVEMLADIGVIKVPITTYPLMWSGIFKDLDNADITQISANYKNIFWRVKKAANAAIAMKKQQQVRVSLANDEQVLRAFGDESRGEFEISASKKGMNKKFSWNIQVTQVSSPFDNDNTRYDNSYVAGIWGNWVVSAGAVEKWWGASWDSANLLSNNARPPLGISVQRNYSDVSKLAAFSWLGTWTFNSFIGELDDQREVNDTRVVGLSFSFKPHQSLEISLRNVSLWGGDDQSESISGLFNNVFADQTEKNLNQNGDRRAGLDFRWRLPISQPLSLYTSLYGESESKFLPEKSTQQMGLTSSFIWFKTHWKYFIEYTDTSLNGQFNQAYESDVYLTGYRYNGLAIGSTYDNDSKAIALGFISRLNRQNEFKLTLSNIQLNRDSQNRSTISLHTISQTATKFNRVKTSWKYQTEKFGNFQFNLDYTSKIYDQFNRINDKYRFGLDWFYTI